MTKPPLTLAVLDAGTMGDVAAVITTATSNASPSGLQTAGAA